MLAISVSSNRSHRNIPITPKQLNTIPSTTKSTPHCAAPHPWAHCSSKTLLQNSANSSLTERLMRRHCVVMQHHITDDWPKGLGTRQLRASTKQNKRDCAAMSYILASTSLHELVYPRKPSCQALPAKSFPPNPSRQTLPAKFFPPNSSRQTPPAKHLPYG